jgi:hypothetical protein
MCRPQKEPLRPLSAEERKLREQLSRSLTMPADQVIHAKEKEICLKEGCSDSLLVMLITSLLSAETCPGFQSSLRSRTIQ